MVLFLITGETGRIGKVLLPLMRGESIGACLL
jgi:hypothetical protein